MSNSVTRVRAFCALCRSRCGCIAVVEGGDRLVAIEPDPSHPTGAALCAKGRASPDLVAHPERLRHPLRRTRPKGDPDPGWQVISWDEALDATAEALRRAAAEAGPESVAFGVTSPSGTAISDAGPWIDRLINAFGSPNNCYATEICNWHKDAARAFTDGAGIGTPDLANAGCMLFWGQNPSATWLAKGTRAAAARARGAKLVVVDPRRVGLAVKADEWLRVRPGTDGALALGIAGVMIERGWYDRDFLRDWSNGPLLVRDDDGRLLRMADVAGAEAGGKRYAAWDEAAGRLLPYDPATRRYEAGEARSMLRGAVEVTLRDGTRVGCRTAFDLYAALCAEYPPERVAAATGVPAAQLPAAARLLWEHRPVAHYGWSGIGQHTNATQTDRAIALLYALTGSLDAPGGNVAFPKVPVNDVAGAELMPEAQRAKALGRAERPLGPPRSGLVTTDDLYRAILDGEPYEVRALVGFGANIAVSHADPGRAKEALSSLPFHVQADLFLTPTASFADIVLPVASAWEREGLRVGFELDAAAQELVQLRPAVVPPRGEARADIEIVFALATRLGLGDRFWHGDIEAALRHHLAPSGLTPEALRAAPGGIRVPLTLSHRKYRAAGFRTPTGKLEIFSDALQAHGYAPLPVYEPPAVGPERRPDLAVRYPLVLTSAKSPHYCHSQHRSLARLRRLSPHPSLEIHPQTAAARGIAEGDWVSIATPAGRARAVARLQPSLDPSVVAAQHGWWQGCAELGLPGYDPFSPEGANYNRLIGNDAVDPISGSVPHRSYLCEVERAPDEPARI